MITSQTFALQKAIINAFERNTDLMDRLADNHVYDTPPRQAAYPFITLGRIVSTPITADLDGFIHKVDVIVYARDGGRQQVLELAEAVTETVTPAELTTDDLTCINSLVERLESLRSRNGLVWQATLALRLVTA